VRRREQPEQDATGQDNAGQDDACKTTPAKSTSPSAATSSGGLPAGLTASVLKEAATACSKTYNTLPSTFGATAKADLAKVCQDLRSGNVSAFKADATSWCNAAIAGVRPRTSRPRRPNAARSAKRSRELSARHARGPAWPALGADRVASRSGR